MTYKPDPKLLQATIETVFGAFLQKVEKHSVKITAFPWLNVRAGAGTSYAVVKRLLSGAVVQVGEVQVTGGEEWGRLADGSGWIARIYNGQIWAVEI